MDLLPGQERFPTDPGEGELLVKKRHQSRERLVPVGHHIDLWRPQGESMNQAREGAHSRESLKERRGCHPADPTGLWGGVNRVGSVFLLAILVGLDRHFQFAYLFLEGGKVVFPFPRKHFTKGI